MAFSDILKVFTQQHPVHTGGAGSQAVETKLGMLCSSSLRLNSFPALHTSHPNCPCSPRILLQLAGLLLHPFPPGSCLWPH